MTDLQLALARRSEILALLSTLPAVNVSESGRSISVDRAGLLEELRVINEMIVSLQGPFCITSTGVTW
jgi:predicted transcriptional regulator